MPNLNIPIRYINIVHLGGPDGTLCVVSIVTDFVNPSKGVNAPPTIEFNAIVPRAGVRKAMENMILLHGHGGEIKIEEAMLDENGVQMEIVF